jgi:hypothetical protein
VLFRALVLASLTAIASPSVAAAQRSSATHSVSDAVYLGGRLEPDGAWLVDYDLEFYVSALGSTGIYLGPNVSFALGASGSTDLGRRQEWLFSIDVLRARWALFQDSYGQRFLVLVGAGLWVASFYDQTTTPRPVVLPDGSSVVASEHFAGAFVPGGQLTIGAAYDWFWDARWAVGVYLLGHVRLDQENRMPAFWLELGVGFRLGE